MVVVLAEFVIVSTTSGTLVAQAGSVLPAGQLLPAAAEVMRVVRILSPVGGLLAVAVNVTVAAAPTARLPVQVRSGLV